MFSWETDRLSPLKILAVSYCNFSSLLVSSFVQPSQTKDEYSRMGSTYELYVWFKGYSAQIIL